MIRMNDSLGWWDQLKLVKERISYASHTDEGNRNTDSKSLNLKKDGIRKFKNQRKKRNKNKKKLNKNYLSHTKTDSSCIRKQSDGIDHILNEEQRFPRGDSLDDIIRSKSCDFSDICRNDKDNEDDKSSSIDQNECKVDFLQNFQEINNTDDLSTLGQTSRQYSSGMLTTNTGIFNFIDRLDENQSYNNHKEFDQKLLDYDQLVPSPKIEPKNCISTINVNKSRHLKSYSYDRNSQPDIKKNISIKFSTLRDPCKSHIKLNDQNNVIQDFHNSKEDARKFVYDNLTILYSQEDSDKIDLLVDIIFNFNEKNFSIFEKIMHKLPYNLVKDYYLLTLKIVESGGEKTVDGLPRTPGGIFLKKIKEIMSPEDKQFVWFEQKSERKIIKRMNQKKKKIQKYKLSNSLKK